MNPIKNILNKITGDAVEKVGNVIDSITTTDEEKLSKKAEISQIVLNALSASEAVQAEVIKTEMKGESWLQRNWRPIVMLNICLPASHPLDGCLFLPYSLGTGDGVAGDC